MKILNMGIMMAGYGLSGMLVPGVVWLITQYSWRQALIILGAGMWVIGIPLSFAVRDSPERYGYLPDGDTQGSVAVAGTIEERKFTAKEVVKTRHFWLLFFTIAFAPSE